jgi:hypothetical protein
MQQVWLPARKPLRWEPVQAIAQCWILRCPCCAAVLDFDMWTSLAHELPLHFMMNMCSKYVFKISTMMNMCSKYVFKISTQAVGGCIHRLISDAPARCIVIIHH